MEWHHEPPQWQQVGNGLTVTSGPKTDFWRKTHYGFIRDNGHFYAETVEGNFVAEINVRGRYQDLYDQAGLMLRIDEANWLKCGIEYVNAVQNVSCVVTRDYSDWSVVPLAVPPSTLRLRLTRQGTSLEVHYALDAGDYALLRVTYLPMGATIQVGPMCASPDGNGFQVEFEGFSVRQTVN